jgi:hypothetical protein
MIFAIIVGLAFGLLVAREFSKVEQPGAQEVSRPVDWWIGAAGVVIVILMFTGVLA